MSDWGEKARLVMSQIRACSAAFVRGWSVASRSNWPSRPRSFPVFAWSWAFFSASLIFPLVVLRFDSMASSYCRRRASSWSSGDRPDASACPGGCLSLRTALPCAGLLTRRRQHPHARGHQADGQDGRRQRDQLCRRHGLQCPFHECDGLGRDDPDERGPAQSDPQGAAHRGVGEPGRHGHGPPRRIPDGSRSQESGREEGRRRAAAGQSPAEAVPRPASRRRTVPTGQPS